MPCYCLGMGRITANDIARLANVSRSTISRVVNDYPNVPDETRRRVMEVINQTGYVPHQQARNLAGVDQKVLLLFVNNNADYYADKIAGSSFFGPLTAYVIDSANRRGYDVIVTQSATPQSWERTRHLLFGHFAAGALFMGVADRDPRVRPFFRVPTVIVDHRPVRDVRDGHAPIVVNFDNNTGLQHAVNHVIAKNCRRIAYITGNVRIFSGAERLAAFRLAMKAADAEIDESLVVPGDFSEQSGYDGAHRLMRGNRPDAIIAGDDECAIGVLRALEELKLKVPQDVSVVGFDDIELARYVRPSLSTVSAPKREIADKAVERLIDCIEDRTIVSRDIRIPTEFVARDS